MTRASRVLRSTPLVLLGLALPLVARAQDYGETSTWEYEAAAYGWFSEVKGTGTVVGEEFPIQVGSPEFWRLLNASFSFSMEARKADWALWVDAAIVNTEDDETFADGSSGTFRVQNTLPSVAGSYRLLSGSSARLEGLAGFRYSDLDLRASSDSIAATAGENWFDPIVGLRLRGKLSDRFLYGLRGDIGGFGVGATLSWNVQAALGYQTSPRFVLGLGYRYYDTDYSSGAGDEAFAFDAHQHGLLAGLILLL